MSTILNPQGMESPAEDADLALMAKQGVNIRHVVQVPDLDCSVGSTAEQLMRAIPES